MATAMWAVALVLIADVGGAFGPIFLKRASDSISFNFLKLIKNWNLIIGVMCYGFGTILFIPALKGGELSVLYPLAAVSYVLVCLYSIKMLKEKMNALKWIGITLIMIGVMFIGLGSV